MVTQHGEYSIPDEHRVHKYDDALTIHPLWHNNEHLTNKTTPPDPGLGCQPTTASIKNTSAA